MDKTPEELRQLAVEALEEEFPGFTVTTVSSEGVDLEWPGVQALLDILNIEGPAFVSDESRIGQFNTTDEEMAAMPVPTVTRDMTLLEALVEIRKTYPDWPGVH